MNGGLRIHIKPHLIADGSPAVQAAFGRPPLADRLLLPAGATAPKTSYLDWHRANVYGSVP